MFSSLNVQGLKHDQIMVDDYTDLKPSFIDPIHQQEILDAEITKISEVLGGIVYDVYVVDDLAYLANDYYGLRIINVSDTTDPVKVGECDDGGRALGIFVEGDYAYVADGPDGLEIIDISDPTNPFEVGQFNDAGGNGEDVYVNGSYAYLADQGNGLTIIDISNPTTPVEVGNHDDGGMAFGVCVSGNFAFVADGADGLEIINVTDSTSPEEVGSLEDGGTAYGVFVKGNYAYMADGSDGLEVIDVTDPTDPTEEGQFNSAGGAYGIYVVGDWAYLADGLSGLVIIDVTIPATPSDEGTFNDGDSVYSVFVSGNYAFVANDGEGMEIIDISTPASPTEVGQFIEGDFARDVCVNGSYAYVADEDYGLVIVDISDPFNPVKVGQVYNEGNGISYGIDVSGAYVYVAAGYEGLEIYNVTDPTSPFKIENFDDGGSCSDVQVSGNIAYVAGGADGLEIIDVSDPTTPIWLGQHDDGGYAVGLQVNAGYAYVADGGDGLEIIDITVPATPVEVGELYDGSGTAYDVCVNGAYAYVADYDDGLEIIDISTPATPVEVGSFYDGGHAFDVDILGNYAYVADSENGLEIINIEDRTSPFKVGQFDDGGDSRGITYDWPYVYVADGDHGLEILQVVFADNTIPEINNISHSPSSPTSAVGVTFTANVTDLSGIQSVVVSYRIDGGSWENRTLLFDTGTFYDRYVGIYEALSFVEYLITATDNSDNHNVAIDDNGGSYYTFTVSDETGPLISGISHSPSSPTDDDYVIFTANVTDPSGIQSVTLSYDINGSSLTNVTMALQSGITYGVTVGPFATGSEVNYFISAIDNSTGHYERINTGHGSLSFVVGEGDHVAPSITGVVHYNPIPSSTETVDFTADVSDPSGILSVTLSYRIDSGTWVNTSMVLGSGTNYDLTLDPFAAGVTVEYFVTAIDDSVSNNIAINDNSGVYYSFTVTDGDWTAPLISDMSHSPSDPIPTDTVTITVSVTDASGVQSVILTYRVHGSDWVNVTMTLQSGSIYEATIGPFGTDINVDYAFYATDDSFNHNSASENNGGVGYIFTVGDFDIPEINDVTHSPNNPTSLDTVTISVSVYDPSGVYSVILAYELNGGGWVNVSMTIQSGSDTVYEATIGPFSDGDTVGYYIIAVDNSANHNVAVDNNSAALYSFTVDDSTGDSKDDGSDDGGNGVVIAVVVVVLAAAGAGAFVFMRRKNKK
ncbi:MAG: LVIVD repeat-containing protein [Candidatus Kariarchaeaceae archaeon]